MRWGESWQRKLFIDLSREEDIIGNIMKIPKMLYSAKKNIRYTKSKAEGDNRT